MAEECITLISGCEVEIVEAELCDIEVIVSTDCPPSGGGGGLPELVLDTTFYVSETGSDITGDGTIGNPFASPQKALTHVDGFRFIGNIQVTISIEAGDYTIPATLVSKHPLPGQINIVGAALNTFLPTRVHYVPKSGPYPGVGVTNDFLVSIYGAIHTDYNTNDAVLANSFTTRFAFDSNNFTGTAAIKLRNESFPSIDKILFKNDGILDGWVDSCFNLDDHSFLRILDCAVFGFNHAIEIKNSSKIVMGSVAFANQDQDALSIELQSTVTAEDKLVVAGGDGNVIEIGTYSTFNGNMEIGGQSRDAIVIVEHATVNILGELDALGIDGAVLNMENGFFNSTRFDLDIYDCAEFIDAAHSVINAPKTKVSLTRNILIDADNCQVNLFDLDIVDDGGVSGVIVDEGTILYIGAEQAHATYNPEVGTITGNGTRIISIDSTKFYAPNSEHGRLSYRPTDMGAGNVIASDDNSYYTKTITLNTTLSFSGVILSETNIITLELTNGGAFTTTFTGVTWLSGSQPALKASGVDILQFFITSGVGVFGTIVDNIADVNALLALKEDKSNKGIANGYASLDSNTKIPISEIPDSVLGQVEFQGTWNANTNTPVIPVATTSNKGDYYVVNVAGNTDIDGISDWEIGDWIISNGIIWDKVDNTDKVSSVAGKTGVVLLDHVTDLANIGTNNHVQIDTHIANPNNPHGTTLEQARSADSIIQGDINFNNQDINNLLTLGFQSGERLSWNTDDMTLNIPTGVGPVVQSGQEVLLIMRNETGVTIPNGSVVKIDTVFITTDRPRMALAKSETHADLITQLFVTTMDVPNNTDGFVTKFGKVRNFDTSAFLLGSFLWLDETVPGGFTAVPPQFPNYRIGLAVVTRVGVLDGEIFVQTGSDLDVTFRNYWNGTIREHFDFSVTSDGAIITGTLIPSGSSTDLTLFFSNGFNIFDTSPPATIVLTAGTDTVPVVNRLYIPVSTKLLTMSTSGWPTEEHIKVAYVVLRSALDTQTEGPFVNQNINDALQEDNGQGHLTHIARRLRLEGSVWDSGVEASVTIDGVPTPDDVFISNTAGVVFQLHEHAFPALDMAAGDHVHVVNHPTTPFITINNVNTQILDALGNTLNNTSFSFVVWGVVNEDTNSSHFMMNLPTSSYAFASPQDAIDDPNNFSVYTIPKDYQPVGFLVARFTFTFKNDVWTLEDTEDLRGFKPNVSAGGGVGGVGVTTFLGLTDSPSAYTGQGGFYPKVNVGETALEFYDTDGDILINAVAITDHISDVVNPHVVTATQLGLGNVDDTSDVDKPISAATQIALDLKKDLSDETLLAIDTIVNANTVIDVFIYATSLDDDGGAWVDQSITPFIKLSIFTLEAGLLSIYNGDDILLPLFKIIVSPGATSVVAKNGKIYVSSNVGLTEYGIDNDYFETDWSSEIVNSVVNDVTVKSDGNMNNTVAVSTNGGVSVIHPDGNVVDLTHTIATDNIAVKVSFVGAGIIWASRDTGVYTQFLLNVPLSDTSAAPDLIFASSISDVVDSLAKLNTNIQAITVNAFGESTGLTKFDIETDNTDSSIVHVTTDYNTGWMYGDIKGAWLASSDITSLEGTELVLNGDFPVNNANWTDSIVSSTVVSGELQVTRAGTNGWTYQIVALVIGQSYVLTVDLRKGTSNAAFARVGTAIGLAESGSVSESSGVTISESISFTATVVNNFISLGGADTDGTTFFDNVVLKEADIDRSKNLKHLQVTGTITRTAVVTGAELVLYSGFDASNHLEQSYNPDLDFGTGDFYCYCWIKPPAIAETAYVFLRGETGIVQIYLATLATGEFRFFVGGSIFIDVPGINQDEWNFIVGYRKNGVIFGSVNLGEAVSIANTDSTTGIASASRFGSSSIDGTLPYSGSVSLFRIGSGSPTTKQIKEIYDNELSMFQENAKCLLQGTSSDIRALDFDEKTNLLTVCSADHITRFNDLVVVDDSAEIKTSISTVCGKEITGI